MNREVPIEDAGPHLREIIEALDPSDEVTILAGGEPVATLRKQQRKTWPCQPGTAKDTTHWMAPDFDAPLDDFREYMP
jgi:antitoxin (DNA-binding transcriptional repressor) of toxin-antitoxin stability system